MRKTGQKLRLNVEQLCVESFETANPVEKRGTVHAQEPADTASGDLRGCICDTAENTCWGGCAPSQPITCPNHYGCGDNETNYQTCMESCAWVDGQAVLRMCWGAG